MLEPATTTAAIERLCQPPGINPNRPGDIFDPLLGAIREREFELVREVFERPDLVHDPTGGVVDRGAEFLKRSRGAWRF